MNSDDPIDPMLDSMQPKHETAPDIEGICEQLRKLCPNGHPRFIELALEEIQLYSNKNHDYASGGDPFGNFKRVASILKNYPGFPYDSPEGVNVIYSLKQLDAILWGLCQGIKHKVEGLAPRSADVSVYQRILRIITELDGQAGQ